MAHYCRFDAQGTSHYGLVQGETVESLTAAPWAGGKPAGASWPLSEVRLLTPCLPSKIVCVGRNYREHASELGNPLPRQPLIFLKPPSAVIGPDECIIYPVDTKRVDYEGELGVVIGSRCRRLEASDDPLGYAFGFTCINDVTARDLQKVDGHFARAKGFDTFCPVGPVIATDLSVDDVVVQTFVNGEQRQQGSTREMIFSVSDIIRFIAAVMTLEPGDLIATGTPPGVGPVRDGDTVEIVIEDIGRLRNTVTAQRE